MGVSGYGNDQELLLLRDQINFYKPELIILVFCADNDRLDNSMNIRYVNYYKPYFEQHKSTLLLKGQPVPHSAIHWFSENPFASKSYLIRMVVNAWFRNKNPEQILVPDPTHLIIREMFQLASKNDSKLLIGLQKKDDPLIAFMDTTGIEYTDLSNDYVFPFSGNHWTPRGHRHVAEKLRPYLRELTD